MATEGGYTIHLSGHVAEVGRSQAEFDRRAAAQALRTKSRTPPHLSYQAPAKAAAPVEADRAKTS